MMDYFEKTVRLSIDGSCGTVEFVGEKSPATTSLISAFKVKRMVKVGCEGYIAFIMEDIQSGGGDFGGVRVSTCVSRRDPGIASNSRD